MEPEEIERRPKEILDRYEPLLPTIEKWTLHDLEGVLCASVFQ